LDGDPRLIRCQPFLVVFEPDRDELVAHKWKFVDENPPAVAISFESRFTSR
jgi:hypothetical protein